MVVLLLVSLSVSAKHKKNKKDYNLNKPDAEFVLPDTLREISGITITDPSTIACIEDENGILFMYNILSTQISRQYRFYIDGDYEGICRVGTDMYILRSDGTLFEVNNYISDKFKLLTFLPDLPAFDNEGLCYDQANNRLLIACKSNPAKGHKSKDLRVIYGFDLKTKQLSSKPLFQFRLEDVKGFIIDENNKHPDKKNQIDPSDIKLHTSDIAINPVNHKFYMLSGVDHLLLVFENSGKIDEIIPLEHKLFRQPEGITFFDNGDMLISNEADHKKATLLRFNYKGN